METVEEKKAGFKKTKLGWIPEDWSLKRLNDVADVKRGAGSQYLNYVKQKSTNSIRLIRIGDFLGTAEIKYVEYTENIKRFRISEGDLLIAGTGATAGITFLVSKEYHDLAFSYNAPRIRTNGSVENYFLYQMLKSELILRQQRALFTGNAQPFLDTKAIANFKLPIPPIREQNKIAQILSTWDTAISETQKLIEQLQLRKKGLMQQLLTGKTRLPGFSGEWEELKAGELFENHTDKNHDGTLEVLSATQDKGVIPRSETGIDIKYDPKSLKNYKRLDIGDFVISLRSFQGGIEYSNYEGLVSPAYTVLREKLPISKLFYKEYMKTQGFINKLNCMIYGIRDGKQISYKEFSTMKILYPAYEEQKAIASVIETADQEISLQQKYLEQLQAQKKGLMQQLLTGRIRVKL